MCRQFGHTWVALIWAECQALAKMQSWLSVLPSATGAVASCGTCPRWFQFRGKEVCGDVCSHAGLPPQPGPRGELGEWPGGVWLRVGVRTLGRFRGARL